MKIRAFIDHLKEIEKEELTVSERLFFNRILTRLSDCFEAKKEVWFRREIHALDRVNREKLNNLITDDYNKTMKEIRELDTK